jgi:hypothetical protein
MRGVTKDGMLPSLWVGCSFPSASNEIIITKDIKQVLSYSPIHSSRLYVGRNPIVKRT